MRKRLAVLVFGDILLSVLAVFSGSLSAFNRPLSFVASDQPYMLRMLIFVFVIVFSSYLAELYVLDRHSAKKEILLRVSVVLAASFVSLSSLSYFVPSVLFARRMLIETLVFFGIFQFFWHLGYGSLLKCGGIAKKVLVLGTGPLAQTIGNAIASTNHHHVLGGYINLDHEKVLVPAHAIVGSGDGLADTVKRERAHKIVVSLSERRGIFPLREVLDCKFSGIEVVDATTFYEEITGKLLIENLTPSSFIFSDGYRLNSSTRIYKRILDLIFSLIGSLMTLPLVPFIACIIKIDSRGPVFYRQVRVGEREKNFVIYKFRTMQENAEGKTGVVWAKNNDSRITRVGTILRMTRLDEIPQLYNVFRGDMSFIGPRPERPEFVEDLKKHIPFYSQRHFVKPGLTGWAQIRYPYGASVKDALEKLRYDMYYIKKISLFFDMMIILDTIKVVLFGRGAR